MKRIGLEIRLCCCVGRDWREGGMDGKREGRRDEGGKA